YFDTPLAALLTAIAYLLVALIILAVVKVLNRTSDKAPSRNREGREYNTQQAEELTALLEKFSDPVLVDVIKKHPGKS
ncbi:hypothetical protein, partial [Methylophaga sp. UBA5088]